MVSFNKFLLFVLVALLTACTAGGPDLKIDYQKYTLENGLEVILHQDKSDPIVAVAILYHVGSNREEKGRTGFAHLFEHILFQQSQHVGQDQFFKKIQEAGGTLNGGTSFDRTIYFEVVPKNALEMVLWLESDRMGYLLSTVTPEAFENQQDVVQNEKRQRVDNNPYGHTNYVIHKLLFPEDHPYNWQVIGSFEDLKNATIEDVHEFFKKWYGPNNATLVIAGDFDDLETRRWVEKYFGEIKPSDPVDDPGPRPVTLSESKRVYYEDNFANAPELNLVFPTVKQYHPDSYALWLLADLLADGKKAPLYKIIVEQEKLAPSVSAFQSSLEMAGYFRLRIRAFPDKSLSDVEKAVFAAFEKFEQDGFSERDLKRVKAKTETNFYNGISSVLGKSFQLANYNEFAGSPDFLTQDIRNVLAVTADDIWRVYNTYIKDRPFVLTSFVPKGKTELIAENSVFFPVAEEQIESAGVAAATHPAESSFKAEKIPTSFDRSVEPPKGPTPTLTLPEIWTEDFENGLKLYGITHDELPLVQFSLTLRGGMFLDDPEKIGVANLVARMLKEGTKNRTPEELEEAIDVLGANINVYATDESIVISTNTLRSKLDETYELVREILLEPRWDAKEFERVKRQVLEQINQRKTRPAFVANTVFRKLLYGDHILAHTPEGTAASVESITLDDLRAYYEANFSPSVAYVTMAGSITQEDARRLFTSLAESWPARDVTFAEYALPTPPTRAQLYFIDMPGAKQSEIRIGYLALPYTDPDYFPATVMNYKLGGSFNGNLNLILREEKGYTYGARSSFLGSRFPGPFVASAAVRTNVTFESLQIFIEEMAKYRRGISEADLEFTRKALVQSNARRFETLFALQHMLEQIAEFDLPFDYIKQQERIILEMDVAQHKDLAQKYLDPDRMIYLVVGDAETQLSGVEKLGLGKATLLDPEGNRITQASTVSAR